MGFGSYDESEQEQPGDHDSETDGEDVTDQFHSNDHRGEESIEDENTDDMMQHL